MAVDTNCRESFKAGTSTVAAFPVTAAEPAQARDGKVA